MKNALELNVINTTEQIGSLVDWLVFHHARPAPYSPTMYIDLEGIDLCREGSLSILTLLIDTGTPTRRVHLIDVHILGAQAFNTSGVKGKTLKDILQNDKIPKVFFDVRNDSDALFAHFGVALQGVEDVQLMESATRRTTVQPFAIAPSVSAHTLLIGDPYFDPPKFHNILHQVNLKIIASPIDR